MTLARNGEKGKLKACDEAKKKKQTEKLGEKLGLEAEVCKAV